MIVGTTEGGSAEMITGAVCAASSAPNEPVPPRVNAVSAARSRSFSSAILRSQGGGAFASAETFGGVGAAAAEDTAERFTEDDAGRSSAPSPDAAGATAPPGTISELAALLGLGGEAAATAETVGAEGGFEPPLEAFSNNLRRHSGIAGSAYVREGADEVIAAGA
jgi:hypothetical protein